MKKTFSLLALAFLLVFSTACSDSGGGNDDPPPPPNPPGPVEPGPNPEPPIAEITNNLRRAEILMDKVFYYFWNDGVGVMYDRCPNEMRGLVAAPSDYSYDNGYTFLWGFSAVLSGYNTMIQSSQDVSKYQKHSTNLVNRGLEVFYNNAKTPPAYACFGNNHDDRYYDDNIWVGIDMAELYLKTGNVYYLNRAKLVWKFVESGRDNILGDGIYWKEGDKGGKHTCSNAPAAVLAMKLYDATQDASYLASAKALYQWTKSHLQDPSDYLYWDNIRTSGGAVEKNKYTYNSGQMIQAAVLLYNETNEVAYLTDAQNIARSAYNHFFQDFTSDSQGQFRILEPGHLWFAAVMFRGYADLYKADNNKEYINAFKKTLDHAWISARDETTCLFNTDLRGIDVENSKEVIMQGGMIEMYARMHTLDEE